ncbi:hypothetical protein WA158_007450 [Blastocystis sp. Blastoise]
MLKASIVRTTLKAFSRNISSKSTRNISLIMNQKSIIKNTQIQFQSSRWFRRYYETFVSQHYKINEEQIVDYLKRKDFTYKENQNEFIIRECCFCEKPTNNKLDNLYKLYIDKNSGSFFCHRCGAQGSWFDFKSRLGDIKNTTLPLSRANGLSSNQYLSSNPVTNNNTTGKIVNTDEYKQYVTDLLNNNKYPQVLSHLTEKSIKGRCLSPETLRKYCVGAKKCVFYEEGNKVEEDCVLFPWISIEDGIPVIKRYKCRSIIEKSHMRLNPAGGEWGLFGWHTIPKKATTIVITEGEYDAMAVYEATGIPTVSLPNGAQSLPVQVLPLLESFDTIYLWMDFDRTGQDNAEKFANKLGRGRVKIVHAPTQNPLCAKIKDACDALRYHVDIRQLIESATLLPHHQIMTFKELKEDLYYDIMHPNELKGIPFLTLPFFNKTLKGHRKGELTVLTGPTGSGKTTLLSQMSLDLVRQGVPTLWGSFEIPNRRLSHIMIRQYTGRQLSMDTSREEYDELTDKFTSLPLYFLRFFGSTQVDQVLDAMEYAVYAYDVEHIILDNLQFMLGNTFKGFEKFDAQEMAIHAFRRFATQQNVHITLVIHPRKESEENALNISSVFGTAKATQEADNVIILQNTMSGEKIIEIKKNRFDGELGSCSLSFNKQSLTFNENNSNNKGNQDGNQSYYNKQNSFNRQFNNNTNNFNKNKSYSNKNSFSFSGRKPVTPKTSESPSTSKNSINSQNTPSMEPIITEGPAGNTQNNSDHPSISKTAHEILIE